MILTDPTKVSLFLTHHAFYRIQERLGTITTLINALRGGAYSVWQNRDGVEIVVHSIGKLMGTFEAKRQRIVVNTFLYNLPKKVPRTMKACQIHLCEIWVHQVLKVSL